MSELFQHALTERTDNVFNDMDKKAKEIFQGTPYCREIIEKQISNAQESSASQLPAIKNNLKKMFEADGIEVRPDGTIQYYMDQLKKSTIPKWEELIDKSYNDFSDLLFKQPYPRSEEYIERYVNRKYEMLEKNGIVDDKWRKQSLRLKLLREFIRDANGLKAAGYKFLYAKKYVKEKTADSHMKNQKIDNETVASNLDEDIFLSMDNLKKKRDAALAAQNENDPEKEQEDVYSELKEQYKAQLRKSGMYGLLKLCDDLANGRFTAERTVREQLYLFAVTFGLSFSPVAGNENQEMNIEKLFVDYYRNHIMRWITGHSKQIRGGGEIPDPTGSGVNCKNYMEVLFLYDLAQEHSGKTAAERLEKIYEAADYIHAQYHVQHRVAAVEQLLKIYSVAEAAAADKPSYPRPEEYVERHVNIKYAMLEKQGTVDNKWRNQSLRLKLLREFIRDVDGLSAAGYDFPYVKECVKQKKANPEDGNQIINNTASNLDESIFEAWDKTLKASEKALKVSEVANAQKGRKPDAKEEKWIYEELDKLCNSEEEKRNLSSLRKEKDITRAAQILYQKLDEEICNPMLSKICEFLPRKEVVDINNARESAREKFLKASDAVRKASEAALNAKKAASGEKTNQKKEKWIYNELRKVCRLEEEKNEVHELKKEYKELLELCKLEKENREIYERKKEKNIVRAAEILHKKLEEKTKILEEEVTKFEENIKKQEEKARKLEDKIYKSMLKEKSELRLLELCDNLANGKYTTESTVCEQICFFADTFGLFFNPDIRNEKLEMDIEKMFTDYYGNQMKWWVAKHSRLIRSVDENTHPVLRINYKNYFEILFLYDLTQNLPQKTATEQLHGTSSIDNSVDAQYMGEGFSNLPTVADYRTIRFEDMVKPHGKDQKSMLLLDKDTCQRWIIATYDCSSDPKKTTVFDSETEQNSAVGIYCQLMDEIMDPDSYYNLYRNDNRGINIFMKRMNMDETRNHLDQIDRGIITFDALDKDQRFDILIYEIVREIREIKSKEEILKTRKVTRSDIVKLCYWIYLGDDPRISTRFQDVFSHFANYCEEDLVGAFFTPMDSRNLFDLMVTYSVYVTVNELVLEENNVDPF